MIQWGHTNGPDGPINDPAVVALFVTRKRLGATKVCTPNRTQIGPAATGSTVLAQPRVEQNPIIQPYRVARPHRPFITSDLGLIKVCSPVALLSQRWFCCSWQITGSLSLGVRSRQQAETSNYRQRQHAGRTAMSMDQHFPHPSKARPAWANEARRSTQLAPLSALGTRQRPHYRVPAPALGIEQGVAERAPTPGADLQVEARKK